jgi:D-arginine dehydrogenase
VFEFDRAFLGAETIGNRISVARTSKGPIGCAIVVNASGAWAGMVGKAVEAMPLQFSPKRRHLISIKAAEVENRHWPFVRCNSIPMYFKRENGRLIASPMDEDEMAPQDCPTDDIQVAQIADRLNEFTSLRIRNIERSWAGLRTFVRDGLPVVGFDPHIQGFFWLAGQGGTGIQASPALGELAASLLIGQRPSTAAAPFLPTRLSLVG